MRIYVLNNFVHKTLPIKSWNDTQSQKLEQKMKKSEEILNYLDLHNSLICLMNICWPKLMCDFIPPIPG